VTTNIYTSHPTIIKVPRPRDPEAEAAVALAARRQLKTITKLCRQMERRADSPPDKRRAARGAHAACRVRRSQSPARWGLVMTKRKKDNAGDNAPVVPRRGQAASGILGSGLIVRRGVSRKEPA